MKLSIIFPTRNEENNITEAIRDVAKHLKTKKYLFEILIVANGCTDKTEEIVKKEIVNNKQLKLVKSQPGYGYALRKGLKDAKGDYLIIYNVDFYDLRLIDLVDIDLYGKDLIIGSKRAHWSKDDRPFIRKAISFGFNFYLKLNYGFRGSDTHGIKVFKRRVFEKVFNQCKTNSGIFDTEFVLRTQMSGFNIADFPVEVKEKRSSRFPNRFFQTFEDIYKLHKSLKKIA
jgi:glycosyltransferase involved in cell wall biosynthesis